MSIIKNEIPILEFDTEQTAVISPVHENLNLVLPKKCVFAFLGEYIDEYAEKTGQFHTGSVCLRDSRGNEQGTLSDVSDDSERNRNANKTHDRIRKRIAKESGSL